MLINEEIMQTIVKWAFIVFVAGFIGQFGKSLTKHFLDWLKKRRGKQEAPKKHVVHVKHTIEPTSKKNKSHKLSKLEKKRQKAELKRLKKGK